jgi:hypothetical protein
MRNYTDAPACTREVSTRGLAGLRTPVLPARRAGFSASRVSDTRVPDLHT